MVMMVLAGLLWSSQAVIASVAAVLSTTSLVEASTLKMVFTSSLVASSERPESEKEEKEVTDQKSSSPSEGAVGTIDGTPTIKTTARMGDKTTSTATPFVVHMIMPFGRSTIWYRRMGPGCPASVASTSVPQPTVASDQAHSVVVTPQCCDDGGVTTKGHRRRRKKTTDGPQPSTNTVLPLPGYPVGDASPAPSRHAFQVPADQLILLYTARHTTTDLANETATAAPVVDDDEDEAEEIIHV